MSTRRDHGPLGLPRTRGSWPHPAAAPASASDQTPVRTQLAW